MMKLERFCKILAAHGADPERWPAPERSAAEALLAASAEARAALADTRGLDRLLDALPRPRPELDAGTVAARAIARSQGLTGGPSAAPRRGWLWLAPSLAGLAGAAVLGFFIGWTETDAAATAAQDTDYSGYVASLDVEDDLL
jgi:hypothetical protein